MTFFASEWLISFPKYSSILSWFCFAVVWQEQTDALNPYNTVSTCDGKQYI
jgi:hypothetical protein